MTSFTHLSRSTPQSRDSYTLLFTREPTYALCFTAQLLVSSYGALCACSSQGLLLNGRLFSQRFSDAWSVSSLVFDPEARQQMADGVGDKCLDFGRVSLEDPLLAYGPKTE